ncbi:hypothetical protein KWV42_19325 [Clostridioides difficile]|uniref:hypothetical protein n=1 Tax=Clostridioides difficile TaxID=1496 RepID=UPI0007BAF4C9|nr:hypothetical protein [Clostridioides difficile]MBY1134000.1 hypothetical protein [Clostridioides difficile]MBY1885526.1 hypothetical protein [Clostridioides difficile]MBZ0782699.1 hypothetical protein [Clostridioides difficile]MBZ0856780.1 hypothetical protein [Clostridioides difficile]MCG7703186.1 hypothetical protein [Clostridioides difficile]
MFLNDIFDIIKFNKKSPIEQLYVIQEEEKPDIKEAEEYYRCNYRFYNSLKEMDSIENIKTEKTRIKTVLDSKNNPSIPFAIAIIAAFISIFFSLITNNIIKDFSTACCIILLFFGTYLCLICESQQKWDSRQKFYMSSLQVLDNMESKKLKERKYKKRR